MEVLIKGLLNVALGMMIMIEIIKIVMNGQDPLGAQVVTGEQEDDITRTGYYREVNFWQDKRYGRNEKPHMMPQKASLQEYERNEDERGDNFNQSCWNQKRMKETMTAGRQSKKSLINDIKRLLFLQLSELYTQTIDEWMANCIFSKNGLQVKMDYWDNYKKPIDEQVYSDVVEYGADLEPSEEELSDLSRACKELDLNRLVPGEDYQIDCGEGKKVYQKEDMAEGCLFSWLSEDVFNRPTYSRFCSLLDNYNPHQGCTENVTPKEKREQAGFIEEISRTAPIKYLHKYVSLKRIVSGDYGEFKRMLTHLWFDLYSQGGTSSSSSAFEHAFVGEIKERGEKEVSGFHNWLQFYLEEAKGNIDYQGYIFPRRRGEIRLNCSPNSLNGTVS